MGFNGFQAGTTAPMISGISQLTALRSQSLSQGHILSSMRIPAISHTLNKKMSNSEAVFGFHEDTNRVTIKIVDKSTKEVIKELPPEKTLDMIARVWEMAGILIDERM